MSKIFEKNYIWKVVINYFKRFTAWVIDLHNKYWSDVFFRTTCNIILLQIVFAVVISTIVAISFNYIYKDIFETLIQGITENIIHHGTVNGEQIFNSIQIDKTKDFLSFAVANVILTLLFSYIIAYITMRPVKNALKAQKRFIGDIAHELRTPLSIIKTNSEVALLDTHLEKNLVETFKSNVGELDRASAIINNLLSFSNLIKPEQIKFTEVNMGIVIDEVIKKLKKLSQSKHIVIHVKKNNPYIVLGNPTAIEQIASNIIKNAIHYTPQEGVIMVEIGPDYNSNVILSVKDNGVGISKNDLSHIFEPFYRADRSRNRKSGGSGLGLTIVSELVKLHMGKISIKSKVGEGTVVTVMLPHAHLEEKEKIKKNSFDEVSIDFKRDD